MTPTAVTAPAWPLSSATGRADDLKIGAQHVVNGKKTDAVAAIMDITKGGAHVGVDALGVKATCQNSILSLRKQGRSLQIGLTTAA